MAPRTPPKDPDPEDPSGPEEPTPPPTLARREKIEALQAELLGDFLTTAEVAEILTVHPRTVGEYLREGKLTGIQLAGGWRVSEKSLREFVRSLSEAPKASGGMFGRFTQRARQVIVLTQAEARRLNHNYIGTEHLLLGLIAEGEGVAAKALVELGVSLETTRLQVEDAIGRGTESPGGHIPFTPRAKKVLELSLREALTLGHNYIGTEHVLLGLIREGEGVAAQILTRPGGVELDDVRAKVIQLLSGVGSQRAMHLGHAQSALRRHLFPAAAEEGRRVPKPKAKAASKPKTKPKAKKPAKPKPAKAKPAKRPPRKNQ